MGAEDWKGGLAPLRAGEGAGMGRLGAGPALGPWAGLAGGGGVTKMSLGECKGAGLRAAGLGVDTGAVLGGAWGGLSWAELCEAVGATEATVLGPAASMSLLNTEAAVSRF